jgi:uncharacterized protein
MTIEFEWDATKAKTDLAKHRISFEEATLAFYDALSITIADPDHSIHESRFLLIGMTTTRRLVVVAHTDRGGRIRIINRRRATRCGSKPAPTTSINRTRKIGAGKYTSGPRFLPADQCPSTASKYGSNMAPLEAGALMTPSRNSLTLRAVMPGLGRMAPPSYCFANAATGSRPSGGVMSSRPP